MWFKQLNFFLINPATLPDNETLNEKLSTKEFYPVTGLSWFSEGFTQPVSFTTEKQLSVGTATLICLKKEERVLPSTVVRDVLEEKVNYIQQEEARTVSRKERKALKEQITDELLPQAFKKSSYINMILERKYSFLLVNQSSNSKVDNAVSCLHRAIDNLEVKIPHTVESLGQLMNEWLIDGEPRGNFILDDYCELKGTGDRPGIIRVSNQDLGAEEVIAHVHHGKTVTRLGLCWRDKISFVLSQDLSMTRIRFLDIIQNEVSEQGEDDISIAMAVFTLNAQNLSLMLDELINLLGGLAEK